MIVGKSKLRKRVYVDKQDHDKKVIAMRNKGYEVVELGRVPVALAISTDVGTCSSPTIYSARHCFGNPLDDVKGKKYRVVGTNLDGAVVKDYSPPLFNVFKYLANFFGLSSGVYDVVRVSVPVKAFDDQVALLTGGVLGRPIALLSHIPVVEPEELIGTRVVIEADFPVEAEIRATIVDYAVLYIMYGSTPWPTEVLVANTDRPPVPGNSGSPAYRP